MSAGAARLWRGVRWAGLFVLRKNGGKCYGFVQTRWDGGAEAD